MIKLKGSKNGVMLAAEVNPAQFNILEYCKEKEILYDRLEDTSIPVNSVSVIPHPDEGYAEVVYFSDKKPVDACIEYVRPLGMYMVPRSGVTINTRTKIVVDGRLTNENDMKMSIGPTHIGHYSREDYARLQKMKIEHRESGPVDPTKPSDVNEKHTRKPVWKRNQKYEVTPDGDLNPGYRALYNLQISNNEHIVKSLLKPMFTLGYGPQPGDTGDDIYYENNADMRDDRPWDIKNMRYLKNDNAFGDGWYPEDTSRTQENTDPKPRVNPIFGKLGDAIAMNPNPLEEYDNAKYTKSDDPDDTGKKISAKNRDEV
jgi:hypothetical protein